MRLLSKIISKRVLNVYSSKIEGVICSAIFKDKRIPYLKYFTADEEEYLIDTSKIYCEKNDIIVVRNNTSLIPATNVEDSGRMLGKELFSQTGMLLGRIEDIEISDTYAMVALYVEGKRIDINDVLKVGEVVIIKEDEKTTIAKFRPQKNKVKVKNVPSVVSIMPEDIDIVPKVIFDNNKTTLVEKLIDNEIKENDYKISSTPSPQKVIGVGSGKYLIGRKAIKTIYGLNNELLIKKDTLVTDSILDTVKSHSKLMELALYTKEN